MMAKKIFRIAGPLLLLAYFVTLILHVSSHADQYQWDFRTHRKAAEIFAAGTDPYQPDVLLSQKEANFLYTYPPFTLFFYALFNQTDYHTAFHIFLLVKSVLLIGLVIFLWARGRAVAHAIGVIMVSVLLTTWASTRQLLRYAGVTQKSE